MTPELTAMRIYADAIIIARKKQQTIGERNDFYVTLQQLETLVLPYKST